VLFAWILNRASTWVWLACSLERASCDSGQNAQRMLQALIVHRFNQVIKNAHPQGFADGIHMVIGGNKMIRPL
jgi:hypothetical protein